MARYLEHAATKHRPEGVGGAASSDSWLSLVAATTSGIGAIVTQRVRVSARAGVATPGSQRLVVQSYPAEALDGDLGLHRGARPLGSVQRAVTPDDLERGVAVNLIQLCRSDPSDAPAAVALVAWVEQGSPDLEFDAREARPEHATLIGVALRGGWVRGPVEVILHAKSPAGRAAA